MTESQRYPSYATCVANALSASRQPISMDGLLAKIASQRPLGKGARSAVYRALGKLFQAVPVAPGRYGWLSHLLAGATFRHPLTSEEIRRGFLLLDELEHIIFFPQFFQSNRPEDRVVEIDLFGETVVHAEASIERKTWSLQLGEAFSEWIDEQGGQNKDDLLIIVKDAVAGKYEVRLNLHEMRNERAIRQRNIQLALMAEELVADDRRMRQAMPTWELAARLIGRGFYHEQPAADDFHYVLHEFSMLRFRDGVGYQLDAADDDDADMELEVVYAGSLDSDGGSDVASALDQALGTDWGAADYPADGSPDFGPAESCTTYQAYLDALRQVEPDATPLSHEDFHLLEAELEMLVRLEEEFNRLLPAQEERKVHLAGLLFIDPDEFLGDDWPGGDDASPDDGPFWSN